MGRMGRWVRGDLSYHTYHIIHITSQSSIHPTFPRPEPRGPDRPPQINSPPPHHLPPPKPIQYIHHIPSLHKTTRHIHPSHLPFSSPFIFFYHHGKSGFPFFLPSLSISYFILFYFGQGVLFFHFHFHFVLILLYIYMCFFRYLFSILDSILFYSPIYQKNTVNLFNVFM